MQITGGSEWKIQIGGDKIGSDKKNTFSSTGAHHCALYLENTTNFYISIIAKCLTKEIKIWTFPKIKSLYGNINVYAHNFQYKVIFICTPYKFIVIIIIIILNNHHHHWLFSLGLWWVVHENHSGLVQDITFLGGITLMYGTDSAKLTGPEIWRLSEVTQIYIGDNCLCCVHKSIWNALKFWCICYCIPVHSAISQVN